MYYREEIINGFVCCQTVLNGEWHGIRPATASERWPELDKIATQIQESICGNINTMSLTTTGKLKDQSEDARYPRQCILEMVISKLEKCV